MTGWRRLRQRWSTLSVRGRVLLLGAVVLAVLAIVEGSTSQTAPPPTKTARVRAVVGPALQLDGPVARLDGSKSVSLDGRTLAYEWRSERGPGRPTIAEPRKATTTVTLPSPGDYVLTLRVSDGVSSASSRLLLMWGNQSGHAVQYVLHVSVDGLRSDVIEELGPGALPTFYRLRREGAYTDNARTDNDYTNTLPNHVSQLSGRAVNGEQGHHWTSNAVTREGTLHSNREAYLTSVFDVVHDHGLRTAMFANKDKFVLLERSYDGRNGGQDVTGRDDGKAKLDESVVTDDGTALVDALLARLLSAPANYTFLHLAAPDNAGHLVGWSAERTSPYADAVKQIDAQLAKLLARIHGSPLLRDHTLVIVTSDHGGRARDHRDPLDPLQYTIPLYLWGADTAKGADLYALNRQTRQDPGRERGGVQAIHNRDVANVAASALGLPMIIGSPLCRVGALGSPR